MLVKIKSIFFSRNIFTFINEKRKINIIKYNKSLQKLINISTVFLMFMSTLVHSRMKVFEKYASSSSFLVEFLLKN